jgi:hypothetical protein
VSEGSAVAAFALSEPGAGSDAAALSLTARTDGPDRWRLTGEKCWISNAPEADFYTVFARTDGPEGKITANVDVEVMVLGKTVYACGVNDRGSPLVKVTGGGTVRVVDNPKKSSANPFVVRVRTQERDVSGPSGVACNEKKGG